MLTVFAALIVFIDYFEYETDKYNNYICIDPHLKSNKPSMDIRAYRRIDQEGGRSIKLNYKKIVGIDACEFVEVGTELGEMFVDTGPDLVLVNKKASFSIWDNWTIREVWIICRQTGKKTITQEREIINNLVDCVKADKISETMEGLGEELSYDVVIYFEETDAIVWESTIRVFYSKWGSNIVIDKYCFATNSNIGSIVVDKYRVDSLFDQTCEYIHVDQGSSFYNFLLNSIEH